MKKGIGLTVMMVLVFGGFSFLYSHGSAAGQAAPTVELSGPVKMSKKASVPIQGKGFKPGQAVGIILTDKDGIQTDIGYALKPEPKADEFGNWSTIWKCGDFGKLVKPDTAYTLTVTDMDYNPLASTTVSFVKADK
jgi:hypothetical protein